MKIGARANQKRKKGKGGAIYEGGAGEASRVDSVSAVSVLKEMEGNAATIREEDELAAERTEDLPQGTSGHTQDEELADFDEYATRTFRADAAGRSEKIKGAFWNEAFQ